MHLPVLQGTIARRILVNFRADPSVVQAKLPAPFRPKLHDGNAIVGICLIRLEAIRPVGVGPKIGLSSESAAHRIAVEWNDAAGQPKEGVFIPRRDTASIVNHLVGGRIFPGQHQLADFRICDADDKIDFEMRSRDGEVEVRLNAKVGAALPETSTFASLADASAFFEGGSLGYSVRHDSDVLDGLLLKTKTWRMEPLDIFDVYSSYYGDEAQFPNGSVVFDHALLMRNIEHEWHAAKPIDTGASNEKL